MDVAYSTSNITGYKQHLPVKNVKLPLKYPPIPESKSANEYFHNKLSNTGSIFDLTGYNSSYIDYISYEILNDLKTLTFTPLNVQSNNFNFKFQSLKVVLPHAIISNNCFSVYFEKGEKYLDEDGVLIVDLIDENFLFITFRIELTDFINNDKSKRLSLDNFEQWGHISIPYSFELRSSPFFLKSVDSLNLVVSLKDGGLLHFQRSDALNDFDVYNFNDSTSLLPLNFINGLFKKSSKKQEIFLEGISSNSVVDMTLVNKFTIVTLSVNKFLKVWNLETHQQVSNSIDLNRGETCNSGSSWLTSVPSKYLQIVDNTSLDKRYLTLHFNANSNEVKCDNYEGGFIFKAWEIIDYESQFELIPIECLTFYPELPNRLITLPNNEELSDRFNNSIWFIQDFQSQYCGDSIQYHILWKSNTSSLIITYSINFDNGTINSIHWSQPNLNNILTEFAPYQDIEYYSDKILNSGSYDDLTVMTSVKIFRDHAGLGSVDNIRPIREIVLETINSAAGLNHQDVKTSWFKLDSLCEEFKMLGEESLAFAVTKQSSILTLHVNGLGIFRPSHYYESYSYHKRSTSEGRLAAILNRLAMTLSAKTYNKVYQHIIKISNLSTEKATELYESFVSGKITDEDIRQIMNELDSIPDVIDIINSLIESIDRSQINELDFHKFNSSGDITILTKLNTVTTFKNIKNQHQSILLNLIVLFLICEVNEQLLILINKIVEKLSNYVIVDSVFDTCFGTSKNSNKVEQTSLNHLENSLFWSGIINKNSKLNYLIRENRLNDAYNFFYGNIISSYDKFIIDIIIELINHGEGRLVKRKFFSRLNQDKIIDRFLTGLVYLINNEPTEFFEIFQNYDFFRINYENSLKDKVLNSLTIIPNIKLFLNSIFTDESNELIRKSNYFHSLSELSKSQGNYRHRHSSQRYHFVSPNFEDKKTLTSSTENEFFKNSLSFEKIAIDNLKLIENPDESISSKIDEYYLNVYEMALVLSNYEVIYDSLSNLSSTKQSKSYNYGELFTKFINHLISNQAIEIIFPPNTNKLYQENYLLIDSILLDIANNELTLSNSLKCYEYLHSWRLFGSSSSLESIELSDKRGAVESLYMFITRFKLERSNFITKTATSIDDIKQYKLKILELYLIILNCLKSFENDEDKWILRSKDDDSLDVIKLDELNIEYFEWLKELETELKEEYSIN